MTARIAEIVSLKPPDALHQVLFHEACHVAVGVDQEHNEKFQECMTRFN
jgi:predicted metal-dependent hydrolase